MHLGRLALQLGQIALAVAAETEILSDDEHVHAAGCHKQVPDKIPGRE